MVRSVTLFLALLLVPSIATAQKERGHSARIAAGSAANDDLNNAFIISADAEYLSSVTGATSEPNEIPATCSRLDFNNSVWWVFTPSESGMITLDTDGSVWDVNPRGWTDTILSIHTGSAHPLTEVACNDDDPGNLPGVSDYTSRIEGFEVAAGTTYYIRVSTYNGGRSAGEARLSFTGPTLVANEEGPNNQTLALSAARPNPTAGMTEMLLSVDRPQVIDAGVYDVLGRRVLTVLSGTASGDTEISIDTRSLREGTYIVRAQGEGIVSARPLTVVR